MAVATIRQEMIEMLEASECSARELSQALSITERLVHEHLPHVIKTVERGDKKLVIRPSECMKCEFVFEDRQRTKKPGKCPQCRGTRVTEPTFRIVDA